MSSCIDDGKIDRHLMQRRKFIGMNPINGYPLIEDKSLIGKSSFEVEKG